uniref:Uncharacterized protein n=1 Tax=Cacopsylla melanoneura TaxID=428564 RepID=A0A8D8U3M2_9HEMI
MALARSSGCRVCRTRLPDRAFSAKTSTGVPLDCALASVKKVPIFFPATICLMASFCMPLQITTDTPLSRAHVAELTFESIPPVPTLDFCPNCTVSLISEV